MDVLANFAALLVFTTVLESVDHSDSGWPVIEAKLEWSGLNEASIESRYLITLCESVLRSFLCFLGCKGCLHFATAVCNLK